MSLKEAREQRLETATHLERLAEDEEGHQASPKPLARG
jgi:hypothetical protein